MPRLFSRNLRNSVLADKVESAGSLIKANMTNIIAKRTIIPGAASAKGTSQLGLIQFDENVFLD